MHLLQEVYWGNTLQSWLAASVIFILVFAALKITQSIAIRKLSKMAAATENQIDDLFVCMLRNTKSFILLIISAYIASGMIDIIPAIAGPLQKVIILLLILQAGLWAGAGISFAFDQTIHQRKDQDASSITTIKFLKFISRFILWIIVLLLLLDNLGVNITGLVAGLGIGGIAVALAVQNILGDLLASLSIILDKPFVIGDFIEVDSLSGTVEYIGLKTTRIRSLSGEQLIFANNDLLKSRIRNYRRMSERRIVFGFGIDYQTPPEKLQEVSTIIREIVEKTENVRFDRVHFKEYGDSSLKYEVVYFVTDRDYKIYMNVQEKINLEIFKTFLARGIKFAYPVRNVFIRHETAES
ncbi:MAG TPA: mechanosensitive ion channel family protein [Smithella sp.]|nr:mechanosensitive ion channel family protein [Smithella sp.]HOG90777.1 mechanosensitive ion channel family protein [Smithella sp.]HQH16657.1 mechanosensitive ion channel family protein [Smithella sp.]